MRQVESQCSGAASRQWRVQQHETASAQLTSVIQAVWRRLGMRFEEDLPCSGLASAPPKLPDLEQGSYSCLRDSVSLVVKHRQCQLAPGVAVGRQQGEHVTAISC